MKLTFTGRAADAAAELVVRSNIDDIIVNTGGTVSLGPDDAYTVEIPDLGLTILSTGERLLLDVLVAIGGTGEVNLWSVADRLDPRNLAAVHVAIATLLGTLHTEVTC